MVMPNKNEKRESQGWPKLYLLGEAFGRWGEEGEAETAGEKQRTMQGVESFKPRQSFLRLRPSQKSSEALNNAKPKQCFT